MDCNTFKHGHVGHFNANGFAVIKQAVGAWVGTSEGGPGEDPRGGVAGAGGALHKLRRL